MPIAAVEAGSSFSALSQVSYATIDRRRGVQLEGEASGLFLSWLGKLPGTAVRLSAVFLNLARLEQVPGTQSPR